MDFSLNVNRVQAVVFVGMRERRRKGRRIGSVRCACRRRAGGDERTCTWKGISRAEEGRGRERESRDRFQSRSRLSVRVRASARPSVQTAGPETDRVVISFVDHHGQVQVYNGHVPPPKLQHEYTFTVTHDTTIFTVLLGIRDNTALGSTLKALLTRSDSKKYDYQT